MGEGELIKVQEGVKFLRSKMAGPPQVGIILGTGLGGLAESIEDKTVISYGEIPHLPLATSPSHAGSVVLGTLGNKRVMALKGRFHYYEGYTLEEVVRPVRLLSGLGVKLFIVTCAAGGLNPGFKTGDLMLIKDHINFPSLNPLRGPNIDEWGPRFPDMSAPYSPRLISLAQKGSKGLGFSLREGVYIWVTGPSMETVSESKMLRLLGADAVGMSTVPEVIAANHLGMEVLGVAVITNVHNPEYYEPVSIEEVVAAGEEAAGRLIRLIKKVVELL